MLTYSLHTNSTPHPRFDSGVGFDRDVAFAPQTALRPRPLTDLRTGEVIDHAVGIFPSDTVTRRRLAWDGMATEVVQAIGHDKVEFRFRAPLHLLVAYE